MQNKIKKGNLDLSNQQNVNLKNANIHAGEIKIKKWILLRGRVWYHVTVQTAIWHVDEVMKKLCKQCIYKDVPGCII